MNKIKLLTASALKQRQTIIFLSAVGGLIITVFILVWLSSDTDEIEVEMPTDASKITTFDIDNESIWVEKSESLLTELKQSDKAQKHQIEELKNLLASEQQSKIESERKQKEQLNDFLMQLQTIKNQKPVTIIKQANDVKQLPVTNVTPTETATVHLPTIGITKGTFNLDNPDTNLKHVSHYVPAGSHVKAVILGGVDASAAVSAQSDPKPVLLRLMDKGRLPNQYQSQLKDCHITAAAFGDVSSERALMRLETISCVNKQGEVFESKVSGYVAGEDGITGVRGQVVHRERELLNHSLVSGLLSGLGKSVESKFSSVTQSPLGTTSTVANDALLKSSVAKGASNALDRYAEYHIERAEQYQPTIQVGAGRVVDVVFTKGWSLKNKKEEEQDD